MNRFVLTLLTLSLVACSPRGTFKSLQTAAEPYQIYITSTSGESARLNLTSGWNSRYIAIAGEVDFVLHVHAPIGPGGESREVWKRHFHFDTGYESWEIVISEDNEQEFIQVLPTTWSAARASLTHLPEQPSGSPQIRDQSAGSPRYRLYLDR